MILDIIMFPLILEEYHTQLRHMFRYIHLTLINNGDALTFPADQLSSFSFKMGRQSCSQNSLKKILITGESLKAIMLWGQHSAHLAKYQLQVNSGNKTMVGCHIIFLHSNRWLLDSIRKSWHTKNKVRERLWHYLLRDMVSMYEYR